MVDVESYDYHETNQLMKLLCQMEKGCVLLLDRCFGCRQIFKKCMANNLHFVCRVKAGKKALKEFYQFRESGEESKVVALKKGRKFEKDIVVRLVSGPVDNKGNPIIIATDLLDETNYGTQEIVSLYRDRWESETHFDRLKNIITMGKLHSKKENRVMQEIMSCLFLSLLTHYYFNRCCLSDISDEKELHHHERPYKYNYKVSYHLIVENWANFFFAMELSPLEELSLWIDFHTKRSKYKFRPN